MLPSEQFTPSPLFAFRATAEPRATITFPLTTILLVVFQEQTELLAAEKTNSLPHVNELSPDWPARFVGRFKVTKMDKPSAENTAEIRPMRLVNATVGEVLG